MKGFLLFSVLFLSGISVWGQINNEITLLELDEVIANKRVYEAQKNGRIEALKGTLSESNSLYDQYQLCARLFDEYRDFQTDSALIYALRKQEIASVCREDQTDALLNIAEIYSIKGLYQESLDILDGIDHRKLDQVLIGYYYHIQCAIYQHLAETNVVEVQKEKSLHSYSLYCDSLMRVSDTTQINYVFARANYLISKGRYAEASSLLKDNYSRLENSSRNVPIFAYLISEAERQLGNSSQEEYYLTVSAITDLKHGVKEYISLRRLAYLLYLKGDINRAYTYMKIALDDALYCNSNIRLIETTQILTVIENEYQLKEQRNKRLLSAFLVSISVLSLLLVLGIVSVYIQMRKIKITREQLKTANQDLLEINDRLEVANDRLVEYNKELEVLNTRMNEMNVTLSESNSIKETYIVRYMDLYSELIDRTELYLNKLMKVSGNAEQLNRMLNPARYTNESLDVFYRNFDLTFLNLFPTFVEDFNRLLKPEEQIVLKEGELLNTELRVYALIRLGITDGLKISRFLRLSLSTIYNCRTQVRNKASVPRQQFEKMVMEIGVVNAL